MVNESKLGEKLVAGREQEQRDVGWAGRRVDRDDR